jgi:predicted enzyme related to lactoylglutathione lyase
MPADAHGRTLVGLTVNLLVRDVAASLPFYTEVLGLSALYSDPDFAALAGPGGAQLMLHADHTYDAMPQRAQLREAAPGSRGIGAEIRLLGLDPDAVAERARRAGATVLVPPTDFPHGWRECHLVDANGYTFAVGLPT